MNTSTLSAQAARRRVEDSFDTARTRTMYHVRKVEDAVKAADAAALTALENANTRAMFYIGKLEEQISGKDEQIAGLERTAQPQQAQIVDLQEMVRTLRRTRGGLAPGYVLPKAKEADYRTLTNAGMSTAEAASTLGLKRKGVEA